MDEQMFQQIELDSGRSLLPQRIKDLASLGPAHSTDLRLLDGKELNRVSIREKTSKQTAKKMDPRHNPQKTSKQTA